MALTNKERIGRMLDGLAAGLKPVVEQAFTKSYGSAWVSTVEAAKGPSAGFSDPSDPQFLLNAIWFHWQDTLGKTLGMAEKNYVAELRLTRNRWAHPGEKPFSGDDVYRAYDTAERLLRSVAAPQADDMRAPTPDRGWQAKGRRTWQTCGSASDPRSSGSRPKPQRPSSRPSPARRTASGGCASPTGSSTRARCARRPWPARGPRVACRLRRRRPVETAEPIRPERKRRSKAIAPEGGAQGDAG